MASFIEYNFLIERWDAWSFEDLGDLLIEVKRDPELADRERSQLLEAVYRLIWKRVQPELVQGHNVSSH